MPLPFYLSCVSIVALGWRAWEARRQGWGLPAGMVLGTVAVWYVGDTLYNNYESYRIMIGDESLTSAWWQVLWFVVAFGAVVQPVHRLLNSRLTGMHSQVVNFMETKRLREADTQRLIDLMGGALFTVWIVLMGIGLIRVEGDVIGLFAPYLGHRSDPWGRGQIGTGFSALLSVANYLQIFLGAAFGVLAAVAFHPKTRALAVTVCLLTFPYYIFDRTRNTMLATALPGVLAYVFIRMRGGLVAKGLVMLGFFLVIHIWFGFVMVHRGEQSIASAFQSGGKLKGEAETRHQGLNMFEELAWIDRFIESGIYIPNGGQRYFADLVNPIPRGLWKDKPTIGLDYAVARGQMAIGPNGEVTATISTGMIGQGVVNFGRVFGPLAAAVLMALWVALLARQDLLGHHPGRMILYSCGLILTFNLGRDITLLVLYPFFFGLGLFWVWRYYSGKEGLAQRDRRKAARSGGA